MKYQIEKNLTRQGYKKIAGVDEVGRGPLAGPVVACAVVLHKRITGLNDSKKLSDRKRRILFAQIMEKADVTFKFVWPEEIDEINILEATKKAMRHCINSIDHDYVLIDAVDLKIEKSQSIIKGDELSASIAAASIVAKVMRDNYMIKLDRKYPEYDFKNNKGYGTKKHLVALDKYGAIPKIHRYTFHPVSMVNQIKFDF